MPATRAASTTARCWARRAAIRRCRRRSTSATDFPLPGDQGRQNSCVGWALGYAIKTYQERVEHGWSLEAPEHRFSPAYIYNQLNGGRDTGSSISHALNLVVDRGVATLARMPYDDSDYLHPAERRRARRKRRSTRRRRGRPPTACSRSRTRSPTICRCSWSSSCSATSHGLHGADSVYNTFGGVFEGGHGGRRGRLRRQPLRRRVQDHQFLGPELRRRRLLLDAVLGGQHSDRHADGADAGPDRRGRASRICPIRTSRIPIRWTRRRRPTCRICRSPTGRRTSTAGRAARARCSTPSPTPARRRHRRARTWRWSCRAIRPSGRATPWSSTSRSRSTWRRERRRIAMRTTPSRSTSPAIWSRATYYMALVGRHLERRAPSRTKTTTSRPPRRSIDIVNTLPDMAGAELVQPLGRVRQRLAHLRCRQQRRQHRARPVGRSRWC